MRERYPAIEPHEQGLLDVGDGQLVYWEVSGNPAGKPALVLHGGPGGGSTPGRRELFDPDAYRIVQFDQRGCGRSTPSAADLDTDLSTNTTEHLVGDIERLREHLDIGRWLVWGGSWGVTLGLAYAQRHPERVSELVLVSVTMTRPLDVHWLYHETGRYFPEQWARFRAGSGGGGGHPLAPQASLDHPLAPQASLDHLLAPQASLDHPLAPQASLDADLVAAYDRLLNADPDPAVRVQAARDWCDWEDTAVSLDPGWTPDPRYADPDRRMIFARLCAHYFSHAAWLEDGELLRNADRLAGIPGVLIHGRLDLGSPPDVAWLLAQAWPDAELHLVDTGHTGGDAMTEQTLAALDRFAGR